MNSRQRLVVAWSLKEPDRVPIELKVANVARNMPEAKDIVKFIDNEADNFHGFPAADFGFMGLKTEYYEEVIEDIPGNFRRIKRVHKTEAGEFYAITKHNYDELDDLDYHWERRYIHTLEEMEKLAEAQFDSVPLDKQGFDEFVGKIGDRGIAFVVLHHPLGRLVRNANMEEVYIWLALNKKLMHSFLEEANQQVAEAVAQMLRQEIGPYFMVVAHEMLLPPWMGRDMFEEFVFPYDKSVNDAIHRFEGKLRIHCHGNCMNFLERMSEMGVDAIEPLEAPPLGDVDLVEAKQKVGDRMLLSGNVPSEQFLSMRREEVRDWVKNTVRIMAPGGGFSLKTTSYGAATGSAKNMDQMRKILDNIEAYIEAALEFGTYPITI